MSVLDKNVVEELLALTGDGDPELLADLIGVFLENAPDKLKTIQSSLAHGDYETLSKAAESLKSSAGNLGAQLVHFDCDGLEGANADQVVPTLKKHLADTVSALTDLRDEYR